jgi:phage shock protein PspC (stress-responsive transcriptional regulator)
MDRCVVRTLNGRSAKSAGSSRSFASFRSGARRLTRSTTDRKIAGVCGGLAEYLKVDSTVTRLVWAILTIVPGAIVLGVAAYLLAWFIMPVERAPQATVVAPVA